MARGTLGATCSGIVLVTMVAAPTARAEDNAIFVPLGIAGAVTVGLVNLGFTAYDATTAMRGDVPRPGIAFAEVGVMALEMGAIAGLSVALDPRDPLPLFAVSLWPAALLLHGIWALSTDRPEPGTIGARPASFDLAPSLGWAPQGASLGIVGRF